MSTEQQSSHATMATQVHDPGGQKMVQRELWEEIRRVAVEEGLSIRALSRRFELDRKTVRCCLKGDD